jgi:hypothetical protein
MAYLLVKLDEDKMPQMDAVDLCKQIETHEGVQTAVIVRSNDEKYAEDTYVMTVNTTERAKQRLDRNDA